MTDAELKSRLDALVERIAEIDSTLADPDYFSGMDPTDAAARRKVLGEARASYIARVSELNVEMAKDPDKRSGKKHFDKSWDPAPIFSDSADPSDYVPSSDGPEESSYSGNDFIRHAGRAVGVPSSLLPKRTSPTFDLPDRKDGESDKEYDARSKVKFDQEKKARDEADQMTGDLVSMAVKAVIGLFEKAFKSPVVIGEAAASATFAEEPTDFMHSGGAAIQGASALTMGMIPGLDTVGKLVGALGGAIDQLNKWSDSLHNTNMSLAEFSGSMAQVQAESQARKIILDQQRGDVRADAARRLSEARDRRERVQAEVMDSFHNRVSAPAMAAVEDKLAEIFELMKKIPIFQGGLNDIGGEGMVGWANEMTDARFAETYGRPLMEIGTEELLNSMNRNK